MDFVEENEAVCRISGTFSSRIPLHLSIVWNGRFASGICMSKRSLWWDLHANQDTCKVEFDGVGKVIGVTSEGENAKCKKVVCDPSYLSDKEIFYLPNSLTSDHLLVCISVVHFVFHEK